MHEHPSHVVEHWDRYSSGDWGSSEAGVGWELLGVSVGGDEGGLWAHRRFPSHRGVMF